MQATWDYLCHRRVSPSHEPSSCVGTSTGSLAIVELPLDITLRGVDAAALFAFWSSFDPGLPEDDLPPPPEEPEDTLFWDLRLRTAPWGTEDWDVSLLLTPPPSGSSDAISIAFEAPSVPSSFDERNAFFSGAPLPPPRIVVRPGARNLLDPPGHRPDPDTIIPDPFVAPWPPLRLDQDTTDWLLDATTNNIILPRPFGASYTFIPTKPSPIMDKVIAAWATAGLLVPYKRFTHMLCLCF